jgi:hypothetical protein
MKLCMFHPDAQPMERGWVGRVDGDRVLHLAAQTLQSFFLGGGGAREHAEYPLDEVTLLVPVLYPPSVRIFDGQAAFEFANPAAVGSPGAVITAPDGIEALSLEPRLAAVIGADGAIGGYSLYLDWRAPRLAAPKDRDFGAVLGPIVATPDELAGVALDVTVRVDGEERLRDSVGGLDWESALACENTVLRPGDVLVSPSPGEVGAIAAGSTVEVETPAIGVLSSAVSA